MPVKIIYDPDNSSGRTVNKNYSNRSLVNGKVINVKVPTPDDYKKSAAPQKSSKRMNFNPNVPRNLTPKGYTKMQLMMSIAQKKYDNIVRKLKGTNSLYEDPEFPLNSVIGNIGKLPKIEWKRPKEINPRADFIVDGFDRSDVEQGQIGDCWLLAVISSMADIPDLFNHIVPKNQSIQSDDYVGVFRFHFWQFGQWVEVLVDDRLPVIAGTNRLIFMHSDESNEFWSALIEKAYAKLNGSYANLSGGTQGEAMEDLTGGLSESIDLTKISEEVLVHDLYKYQQRCCLMGCSVTSKEIEAKLQNGLIAGHAYSVTGVEHVTYQGKQVNLVRVRNPWGNNYEWKGKWADNAPEWKLVSPEDKKRLDVTFGGDGEFWMSVEDFMTNFTKLEVCHLGHGALESDMTVRGKKRLEETFFSGEWTKNVNAGGCANFRDTFWTNPQFKITVTDPDPTDNDDTATLIIGLMQTNMRRKAGARFLTIGFCVYQIPPDTEGLMKRNFFNMNRPISISEFTNTREVVVKLKVKPGCYLIVPSTFNPNEEAQFIIRAFTETIVKESECDDKNSFKGLSEEMLKAIKEAEKTKNEDDFVDSLFNSYKDPVTKSINAEQLRDILNKSTLKASCTDPNGFTLETTRSMLASMDSNLTGKMEYDEFKKLWENCQCWRDVFCQRDKDKSKNFNVTELREALMDAGFNLSGMVFTVVVQRFVTQKINAVTFEDWILCCVRLKNCFENMKAQFKTNDGHLIFTESDFLRLTLNQ
uniref:Calpain catalytic domain-containing protein n=1 Tax=Mesocestoides corti TaxID=53468 RepID=A0A5K3FGV6_MESCO